MGAGQKVCNKIKNFLNHKKVPQKFIRNRNGGTAESLGLTGLAVYVAVNRLKPKHPLCVSYALHRSIRINFWGTLLFGYHLDFLPSPYITQFLYPNFILQYLIHLFLEVNHFVQLLHNGNPY